MDPVTDLERTSYLRPKDAAMARQAFRRLFAVELDLADPPVFIQLYRQSVNGWFWTEPQEVALRPANRESREQQIGALVTDLSAGAVAAWAPWDVRRGDTFKLGTATAVIRDVYPVQNGVQEAAYEVQDGGGVT